MGHSSHGMSTVYEALQAVFASKGGHLVESKGELLIQTPKIIKWLGLTLVQSASLKL